MIIVFKKSFPKYDKTKISLILLPYYILYSELSFLAHIQERTPQIILTQLYVSNRSLKWRRSGSDSLSLCLLKPDWCNRIKKTNFEYAIIIHHHFMQWLSNISTKYPQKTLIHFQIDFTKIKYFSGICNINNFYLILTHFDSSIIFRHNSTFIYKIINLSSLFGE